MKIIIKDKEIELKQTYRTEILFENAMKEQTTDNNTYRLLVYFYCNVLASSKNLVLSFDEFIDELDTQRPQRNLLDEYIQYRASLMDMNNFIKSSQKEEKTEKKTKTTKRKG